MDKQKIIYLFCYQKERGSTFISKKISKKICALILRSARLTITLIQVKATQKNSEASTGSHFYPSFLCKCLGNVRCI